MKKRITSLILIVLSIFSIKSFAQENYLYDALLDNAFTNSPVKGEDILVEVKNENVTFDKSMWLEGIAPEQNVFHSSIKNIAKDGREFEVRVGKGGQIYSIINGGKQIIPPQVIGVEWMDEVFQLVSIAYSEHNPAQLNTMHFIHQAGDYLMYDAKTMKKTFYSPLLAYKYDENEKSYSTLSWGQHPQVPNVNKSGILYYQKTRFVEDGVYEVTYNIYNYSPYTINDISFPWGGVRKSTFNGGIISTPNGGYKKSTMYSFGSPDQWVPLRKTDGWFAYTQNFKESDSLAFGWVFGRDKHFSGKYEWTDDVFQWQDNLFTWGDANRDDYIVGGVAGRFNLKPFETVFYRQYHTLGTQSEVIEKSKKYAPYVDYGLKEYKEEENKKLGYKIIDNTVELVKNVEDADFVTNSVPMEKSVPLFLMRNTETNRIFMSSDPYSYSAKYSFKNPYGENDALYSKYQNRYIYKPYDRKVEYLGILGFLSIDKEGEKLSEIINNKKLFPMSGEYDKLLVSQRKD